MDGVSEGLRSPLLAEKGFGEVMRVFLFICSMSSSHLTSRTPLGRSAASALARHSRVLVLRLSQIASNLLSSSLHDSREMMFFDRVQRPTKDAYSLAWSIRYGRLGKPSRLIGGRRDKIVIGVAYEGGMAEVPRSELMAQMVSTKDLNS